MDRIGLIFRIWPYFYFNYIRKNTFDQDIKNLAKIKDTEEFTDALLNLIDFHYIASVMSLSFREIMNDNLFRFHFCHMQMGAAVVATVYEDANSPEDLIEIAINELLYDDLIYNWSRMPRFGQYHSFHSIKSILYDIQKELHN